MKLNDKQIKAIELTEGTKLKKYSDGNGLYLYVRSSGKKSWYFDYRLKNKQTNLMIGEYPYVTLKEARIRVVEYRGLLDDRIDPKQYLKEQQHIKRQGEVADRTLGDACVMYMKTQQTKLEQNEMSPATYRDRKNLYNKHIAPHDLCDTVFKDVTPIQILTIIKDANEGKATIGRKAAFFFKDMFNFAILSPDLVCDRNLYKDIEDLVPKDKSGNYAAMTHPREVGKMLVAISQTESFWLTKLAVELSLHWLTRPSDIRFMEWSEVDLSKRLITIPRQRMKQVNGIDPDNPLYSHTIPLSQFAYDMLCYIQKHRGTDSKYVFGTRKRPNEPVSENTLNNVLKYAGYNGQQTCHGLRATGRTMLEEELQQDTKLAEHQLAHIVRDANGTAYNRATRLKERFDMCELWSSYLCQLKQDTLEQKEIKSSYEQQLDQINAS